MSTQGFLLIATGHPYYGRMAANLASSIKAASPHSNISLLTDGLGDRHLNESERGLFDDFILVDSAKGHDGAMDLRCDLARHTPYDETIAMDVHTLWLPKANPDNVFLLLDGRDFTISNEGFTDLDNLNKTKVRYGHWADPKEIKEAYGLHGKLYAVRGEFIVFRKSDAVEHLFSIAREIRREPAVESAYLGNAVTDEFAINIAMNFCGIEPHKSGWEPAYWPILHGNLIPEPHKLNGYYAVSFGGNKLARQSRRTYDIIAQNAAIRTGVAYRFQLAAKSNFSPERRKA